MDLTLRETDFDTILPFWSERLWKGRGSPIRPCSTMLYMGGKDQTIHSRYTSQARFFAMWDNVTETIIGVFSGHPTTDDQYRARGLYVDPDYARIGIGRMLVDHVFKAATTANAAMCWCIPRVNNTEFFERCGFVQTSLAFTDDVEFGPNVYMVRQIKPF